MLNKPTYAIVTMVAMGTCDILTTTIGKWSNNAHIKPNKMIIINNKLANKSYKQPTNKEKHLKTVNCIVDYIRNWNQHIAYFVEILSKWLILL